TNGFVEKIDLSRATVAYNNLLSEKEKVERLIGLTESVLKFQMGLEIKTQIMLTDSLSLGDVPTIEISASKEFSYPSRIEYSLLETQKKLNELEIKRGKFKYLPSIFLYGNYSAQAQRNEFDFFDTEKKWYPIGIIGGTISLPLFDGLQNHYRIQQSKINLMKTVNTMNNFKNVIDLEIETSKASYLNALTTLNSQKTNTELAKEVYDVAKKKYDQGTGSNIEVMNAETALKEAQTNYYNAMYDYFTSKVDYEKATGLIK
ncbi:MAG: TolC family protein, partial [Bacteroidia bacterium]